MGVFCGGGEKNSIIALISYSHDRWLFFSAHGGEIIKMNYSVCFPYSLFGARLCFLYRGSTLKIPIPAVQTQPHRRRNRKNELHRAFLVPRLDSYNAPCGSKPPSKHNRARPSRFLASGGGLWALVSAQSLSLGVFFTLWPCHEINVEILPRFHKENRFLKIC